MKKLLIYSISLACILLTQLTVAGTCQLPVRCEPGKGGYYIVAPFFYSVGSKTGQQPIVECTKTSAQGGKTCTFYNTRLECSSSDNATTVIAEAQSQYPDRIKECPNKNK